MKSRIMYLEDKSEGQSGPARIGRVSFSKTGSTLHYGGREFQSLRGKGIKGNYIDVETGNEIWISGPKKDGSDSPDGGVVEIDEDIREEYWLRIRGLPECQQQTSFLSPGQSR